MLGGVQIQILTHCISESIICRPLAGRPGDKNVPRADSTWDLLIPMACSPWDLLVLRDGSPEDLNVPRAGSPRNKIVPRAGSPEVINVTTGSFILKVQK